MKKTYIVNDIVWMAFASLVCLGGLKLGFGSFHQPLAGFMPFLAGAVLGILALIDLVSGVANGWAKEKKDSEIWSNISWGKLISTLVALFLYTIFFTTLGFTISTVLLLFFLYRVMEPKTWYFVVSASIVTTVFFYVAFKIGLDSQLPRGFLGF
ncbi:MAG TPA: tripartite tricarboxylate transporter TctB family protein [Thermodesulfobacteriota bacterium]|nr:tripartite tricarboxylate transporter TctB family protein [Thermodesulfobacteriota bacterium]